MVAVKTAKNFREILFLPHPVGKIMHTLNGQEVQIASKSKPFFLQFSTSKKLYHKSMQNL